MSHSLLDPATRPVERARAFLSREVVGGGLLLGAAAAGLVLANSPAGGWYAALRDRSVGGEVLGLDLDLTVAHWAADGLLAVFFFLVGLELKREFVAGELRDPRKALVPVAAAVGGVVVPAVLFVAINAGDDVALQGWAIPAATDIAIALAVLAMVARNLPPALRTFLLTLAVVDDLIAITIIAVGYTADLALSPLVLAVVPLVCFALLARRGADLLVDTPWAAWAMLFPLGAVTWALVHESGLHATLAGVALALTAPVRGDGGALEDGLAQTLEHRVQPWSAGVCVPVFAFFSAGVAVGGTSGFVESLGSPVAVGIVVSLVIGKILGIAGTAWLVTRLPVADLDHSLEWIDVLGLASLAGIGFTVSLLITELSYPGSSLEDVGKVGVLTASLLAAAIGTAVLWPRDRRARRAGPSTEGT
ncbi:Na+/H+ antiporter NhaA [Nocardioides euryhalodurans]|uniref:Na(+)/H(+) antiporter NhaA n=1 Tax=Nocardioides euryhalodurans TaxID=2518370 RepID=A0A4P7GMF0_9ACTN|nr:Na+/H+ antiporter NhaA [Nocardioides euryhalodurans]QBR92941.1 Na+/H+ antiporter NhaA [Nocardioides euryhalodurans]